MKPRILSTARTPTGTNTDATSTAGKLQDDESSTFDGAKWLFN
jgi:hypothetical protein